MTTKNEQNIDTEDSESSYKTTIPEIDEMNVANYNRIIDRISSGVCKDYSCEKQFYKGNVEKIYKSEAIRLFCKHQCCSFDYRTNFDKAVECPSRTETRRIKKMNDPDFCVFAFWNTQGVKHIPNGFPKITASKAIKQFCQKCQDTKTTDKSVRSCGAFWLGDHNSDQCPLHPFRMGGNPWSTKVLSAEHIEKMKARAKECRESINSDEEEDDGDE